MLLRSLLAIAAILVSETSAMAQGGIHWANTASTLISITSWDLPPTPMPPRTSPQTTFYFGLFVAPFGTAAPDSGFSGMNDPAWQFVAAYTTNSSSAVGAGRMANPGTAHVSGYGSGNWVSFIVRGWQSYTGGANWEAAKPGIYSYGQSALGSVILGEGALPNPSAFGIAPGQIPGFTVFVVPEPTCAALFALGAIGLFRCRSKG